MMILYHITITSFPGCLLLYGLPYTIDKYCRHTPTVSTYCWIWFLIRLAFFIVSRVCNGVCVHRGLSNAASTTETVGTPLVVDGLVVKILIYLGSTMTIAIKVIQIITQIVYNILSSMSLTYYLRYKFLYSLYLLSSLVHLFVYLILHL